MYRRLRKISYGSVVVVVVAVGINNRLILKVWILYRSFSCKVVVDVVHVVVDGEGVVAVVMDLIRVVFDIVVGL